MMPSGTLSEWLYEVLSPHAEKVVVAAVSESRGPKDDRRDAFGLAEGLRLGAIRRTVYKERGGFGALGYHAKGYRWIRSDGVRVRNRLKALCQDREVSDRVYGKYSESAHPTSSSTELLLGSLLFRWVCPSPVRAHDRAVRALNSSSFPQ